MPAVKRKFGDACLEEHLTTGDADTFEASHVHRVYEAIAPHFSATRYKAWPQVGAFVARQPEGSVIIDVGAGNGKSLAGLIEPNKHILIATDASEALLRIAVEKGLDAVTSNALALPMPSARADCVISIAMLHHLSTPARRAQALAEMMRVLRPGGALLVYVWAAGQKRFAGATTQDVTVPWTLSERFRKPAAAGDSTTSGDGDKQPASTGPPPAKKPHTAPTDGPAAVGAADAPPSGPTADGSPTAPAPEIHDRYYHLYNEGELEASLLSVGGVEIVRSYYDCDNWCVEAKKKTPGADAGTPPAAPSADLAPAPTAPTS